MQKKGLHIGKTKRSKWTMVWATPDHKGLPFYILTAGASAHKVKWVLTDIPFSTHKKKPATVIRDMSAIAIRCMKG